MLDREKIRQLESQFSKMNFKFSSSLFKEELQQNLEEPYIRDLAKLNTALS